MSKQPSASILLDEIKKTIDAKGEESVIKLLRNAREIDDNKIVQFVVTMVITHFAINRNQLIHDKTDTSKYAKGFIIFYLRQNFDMEWWQLKILLELKDQSWLYKLMKLVRELKPKLPAHAMWLAAKSKFDNEIKKL